MLATIGIVDCTLSCRPLPIPFPLLCMGNSRFNGAEQNENVTVFFLLLRYVAASLVGELINYCNPHAYAEG